MLVKRWNVLHVLSFTTFLIVLYEHLIRVLLLIFKFIWRFPMGLNQIYLPFSWAHHPPHTILIFICNSPLAVRLLAGARAWEVDVNHTRILYCFKDYLPWCRIWSQNSLICLLRKCVSSFPDWPTPDLVGHTGPRVCGLRKESVGLSQCPTPCCAEGVWVALVVRLLWVILNCFEGGVGRQRGRGDKQTIQWVVSNRREAPASIMS